MSNNNLHLSGSTKRVLQQIADQCEADRFEVVRVGKHRIVDMYRGDRKVRIAVALSPSDHRALKNLVTSTRNKFRALEESQ